MGKTTGTLLRRVGNKSKLAPMLAALMPERISIFIDMFFGTGAMSFEIQRRKQARYIIANDSDQNVVNLFEMVKTRKDELLQAFHMTPYHDDIFWRWKEHQEADPIWQAVRFLYLSNFSFHGMGETLKFECGNSKAIAEIGIEETFDHVAAMQFLSDDFRDVLSKINIRTERDKQGIFLYADPPYIGTENNYHERTCRWTAQDAFDLFKVCVESGLRFGISEFDGPLIRELAASHKLHITEVCERRSLSNRNTEIFVTNYQPGKRQMGLFN